MKASHLQTMPDIRTGFAGTSDTKSVGWREIFKLQIADKELRKHVAGFLDFFQKNIFESHVPMENGRWGKGRVNGAEVMKFIKKHHDIALEELKTDINTKHEIEKHGLMAQGKFLITEHNTAFNPSGEIHSGVAEVELDACEYTYPVSIRLVPDEIKKSRYRTSSGKSMPVSIDMTLAHELGHFIYPHADPETAEACAMLVEHIIMSHMKVPTRGFGYGLRMLYETSARENYNVHYAQFTETAPTETMPAPKLAR